MLPRGRAADASVRAVIDTYLEAVDVAVPGLIEGLYLIGSIALDDFRPGQSDIDFVAATATRPDSAAIDALRRVHSWLQTHHPRPYFDGVYVTWEELRRDPIPAIPSPFAHEGHVAIGAFGLDPVTWHTVAHQGVVLRGPDPSEIAVWADSDTLATWTRGNLDTYWRHWHDLSARWYHPAGLGTWAPTWGVLGVTRVHYTLATGAITSKSGAGRYALDTFPARWHRVVRECLRIRRRVPGPSLNRSPIARRREALDYIAMVMADARGRWPAASGESGR